MTRGQEEKTRQRQETKDKKSRQEEKIKEEKTKEDRSLSSLFFWSCLFLWSCLSLSVCLGPLSVALSLSPARVKINPVYHPPTQQQQMVSAFFVCTLQTKK
jgi:hypothetical protein